MGNLLWTSVVCRTTPSAMTIVSGPLIRAHGRTPDEHHTDEHTAGAPRAGHGPYRVPGDRHPAPARRPRVPGRRSAGLLRVLRFVRRPPQVLDALRRHPAARSGGVVSP